MRVFLRETAERPPRECRDRDPVVAPTQVTAEGAFPPAEEVDAHYPGSPTLGYFPPWANTYGCVQDVVYYDLDDDALAALADGVASGSVNGGGCYDAATFAFARAPGTNAYLLVIDDIEIATTPQNDDAFECTLPPHSAAMSSSMCTRFSPKPGAWIAVTFRCPLTWLCTSIWSALPSTFSATITRGRGSRMIFSSTGINDRTSVIFSELSRM